MFGLVLIVALVSAVIVGTVLGRRYRVGPPVLLILLGSLLGLIPSFGGVRINGEIVLLLFLPAILYWESLNTSFREIRKNLRVIVTSAIGLVIVTAVAVSWTARALGMESHAAAVLGAVLSPPTLPPWPAWRKSCHAGPSPCCAPRASSTTGPRWSCTP